MKYTQGVINLYKRVGETPKERLDRFRKENPEYAGTTLSYAGRLDPMAEGVLLVLIDEENKKRAQYLSFTKDYVCEIVWGFATDTYDILGFPEKIDFTFPEDFETSIESEVTKLHMETHQEFPPFSSKPVKGKALFEWAREGKIDEIEIPIKDIHVEDAYVVSHTRIPSHELFSSITEKISSVSGDFRQKEIISRWERLLHTTEKGKLRTTTVFFSVSSGTYIRGLIHQLGRNLGCGAVSLSLIRTRVGEYDIEQALK